MIGRQTKIVNFFEWKQSLKGNIPALDGLRGIAILLVVWHNAGTGTERSADGIIVKMFQLVLNSGWVGVQLFFVLSGFLITGILLDNKGQPKQFQHFYIRRILRIFPLYYATLVIFFFILPCIGFLPIEMAVGSQQQLWYWIYLVNWISPFIDIGGLSHFWSLAIEEQFYCIWPLCVIFLPTEKILKLCALLVVSAIVSRYILLAYFPEDVLEMAYTFTVCRWDALALGAALAVLVRTESGYFFLCRNSTYLFLLISAAIIMQITYQKNFAPVGEGSMVFNQTLIALWFTLGLFFSINTTKVKLLLYGQQFLACFALKVLAKYSYAIYVFHMIVLKVLFDSFSIDTEGLGDGAFLLANNYNCFMVLLVSFVMAYISWHTLESHFLRYKIFFS